jgi:hypothetical protein
VDGGGGDPVKAFFEAVLVFLVGSALIFLGVVGVGLFLAAS